MNFASVYDHGFARVAACTVPITVADPERNAAAVLGAARECSGEGVALAVFPELVLTGYSAEDLLLQDAMLDAVETALAGLVAASTDLLPLLVVGAPLRARGRVYNCAVAVHRGRVLGVAPKSYLPNYREFYERRQIASGDDARGEITVAGSSVPFGPDLLFRAGDLDSLVVHVEVCEDMWVPIPPSAQAALAGATVLVNISGSPITVAKARERARLTEAASARCLAAYVYAAGGQGESTTDLSWDGQTTIHENGTLLAESERFPDGPRRSVADVHLTRLRQERMRQGTFDDNRRTFADRVGGFRDVVFELDPPRDDLGLRRRVDRFPFVPDDPERLAQDCYEAYSIQVAGLQQRLTAIGAPKAVIGVSGGLDSTQALIVAARAMDRLQRPRSDILAVTLPGFATTQHTKGNAVRLMKALGVTWWELDIRPLATQLLTDLDHPFARGEPVYDITFENVQAGVRTDYLFRLANQRGGLVVGTGDLSELALGWATYGVGDHMSHYGVNSGVPKTLMQHLLRWVIRSGQFDEAVSSTLQSILDTTITPELVPTSDSGEAQSTEAQVGPYALQDFTLYYLLRHGFAPSTIAFLAWHAWHDADAGYWPEGYPEESRPAYDLPAIQHWMEVFLTRFFANQFKRSALPNGPKVVRGGSLSPRGDWRMPSDAPAAVWLAELHRNVPESDPPVGR